MKGVPEARSPTLLSIIRLGALSWLCAAAHNDECGYYPYIAVSAKTELFCYDSGGLLADSGWNKIAGLCSDTIRLCFSALGQDLGEFSYAYTSIHLRYRSGRRILAGTDAPAEPGPP